MTNPVSPTAFGHFVWTEFHNSAIKPDALRALAAQYGVCDPASIVDIDEVSAVRSAAKSWKTGRGKADRFRSDCVFEDDDVLVVGILGRVQVASRKVEWHQIDSLVFDKHALAWISTGVTDEATRFRAVADEDRIFVDHAVVRPIVQTAINDLQAAKLRRSGGLYFVPSTSESAGKLASLSAFVESIGDSYLAVADQYADNARKSTAREVQAGLADHLADLATKIDEWRGKVRSPRKDAVANLLAEFADLRSRAEVYAEALSFKIDDLRSEIESVEGIARGLITGDETTAPSAGLVAILSALTESAEETDSGTRFLFLEDFEGSGLPDAAISNAAQYWTTATAGRRAFLSLGFEVVKTAGVFADASSNVFPFRKVEAASEEE